MKNKELKRAQQKINRFIHSMNRNLYEDVFKNRFSIHQVSRQDLCECGGFHFSNWCRSAYLIEFRDNEEPERDYSKWFDCWDVSGPWLSSGSVTSNLNTFIIESDFWEKWRTDEEYKKNHWYSGEQLKQFNEYEKQRIEFERRKDLENE